MKQIIIVAMIVAMALSVNAVNVIKNASFEEPLVDHSGWQYNGDPTDWSSVGFVTRFEPSGPGNPYGGWDIPPSYGDVVGGFQNGTMYQDITDSGSSPILYEAAKIYVFSLEVGGSYEGEGNTAFMKLLTSGATELASRVITNHNKAFQSSSVEYVAPGSGSPVGEQIRVQIEHGAWGGSFCYDMASLEIIPEPALGIIALLGMVALRFRT